MREDILRPASSYYIPMRAENGQNSVQNLYRLQTKSLQQVAICSFVTSREESSEHETSLYLYYPNTPKRLSCNPNYSILYHRSTILRGGDLN